jgi:hypothetical protein
MRMEQRVRRHLQRAIDETDDLEGAANYLAVWIANTAASSKANYVMPSLVEAYRRMFAQVAAQYERDDAYAAGDDCQSCGMPASTCGHVRPESRDEER